MNTFEKHRTEDLIALLNQNANCKIKEEELFGKKCYGDHRFASYLFQLYMSKINFKRVTVQVTWQTKTVTNALGKPTNITEVELFLKGYPNILFSSLTSGVPFAGTELFCDILTECGFPPQVIRYPIKTTNYTLQRDPTAYVEKEELTEHLHFLIGVLVSNGVSQGAAQNLIFSKAQNRQLGSLNLDNILKHKRPQDIVRRRDFNTCINKCSKWRY